jgi:hypothetical protein
MIAAGTSGGRTCSIDNLMFDSLFFTADFLRPNFLRPNFSRRCQVATAALRPDTGTIINRASVSLLPARAPTAPSAVPTGAVPPIGPVAAIGPIAIRPIAGTSVTIGISRVSVVWIRSSAIIIGRRDGRADQSARGQAAHAPTPASSAPPATAPATETNLNRAVALIGRLGGN